MYLNDLLTFDEDFWMEQATYMFDDLKLLKRFKPFKSVKIF